METGLHAVLRKQILTAEHGISEGHLECRWPSLRKSDNIKAPSRSCDATLVLTLKALRSGFTPIINAMAATGVVSLPGMMTGQILSGVDPREAVKYQLLIMFLLGGATGLGVLGATFASVWRLTDSRHRLRLDRLSGGSS